MEVEIEAHSVDQVANVRYKYLLRCSESWKRRMIVPISNRELSSDKAVLALFAFDKAKLGDIWYDRATRESEANLDQWRRENPERMGEN